MNASQEAAGRRRLARRGMQPAFAGVPSPLGPAGNAAFDGFIACRRGPPALLAEIAAVEQQLVDGFEAAGRTGRLHARVSRRGPKRTRPGLVGRMRLDFARNSVALPDGSAVAGIEVASAPAGARDGPGRERPARAMLREA